MRWREERKKGEKEVNPSFFSPLFLVPVRDALLCPFRPRLAGSRLLSDSVCRFGRLYKEGREAGHGRSERKIACVIQLDKDK
mmetsp:Transcript_33094/g.65672  ORF Transcript_33094/g.65672 Transcript_33094/m.65672 type:complete len:82 (-) Transcript_33094:1512-1757(-)